MHCNLRRQQMTYFKELGYITTMDDVRAKEKRPTIFMIVGLIGLISIILIL